MAASVCPGGRTSLGVFCWYGNGGISFTIGSARSITAHMAREAALELAAPARLSHGGIANLGSARARQRLSGVHPSLAGARLGALSRCPQQWHTDAAHAGHAERSVGWAGAGAGRGLRAGLRHR